MLHMYSLWSQKKEQQYYLLLMCTAENIFVLKKAKQNIFKDTMH